MTLDHDYETEPIGGDNPYYRCVHCKRSDPEINGRVAQQVLLQLN